VVLSGTPASSTTKTGRHDIAEILLKMALNTKNQIKSINCITKNKIYIFGKSCTLKEYSYYGKLQKFDNIRGARKCKIM
jgi:hypothetical protein